MSSRCVKWSLLAAVLLLVLPVVAGASTSRLMGMGVQSDFVKDYTNIFTYPSCLPNVGNVVYGELGQTTDFDFALSEYFTTEDRSVGAVLGNLWDGRFGAFGFTMREYSPALGTNFQPFAGFNASVFDEYYFGTGFESFATFVDPNVPAETGDVAFTNHYGTEALDLMWGKKFDKLSLGLRLNRSYFKFTNSANNEEFLGGGNDLANDTNDRNIWGFGGGIGYDMSDKTMLEAALLWQTRTYKFKFADGSVDENDGGGAYLASARIVHQWRPDVTIVPMARFYSFDLGAKTTPAGGPTTSVDHTVRGWQAGAAGNWALNQNDLFVLGLSFAQNTEERKTAPGRFKDTENLLPTMFAGLETHVNHWLTLRFGGRKGVFYSVKSVDNDVTPATETKTSWSPFIFYMGSGVKLGTLQLDATLAQDFFHNPASYLNAPTQSGDMFPLFPRVTASYSF